MDPNDPFTGPDRVIVELAGAHTEVSLDDAAQMRTAIVAGLRASALEGKDQLVTLTAKAPIWIDPEGGVRIGGWVLTTRDAELRWTFRMASDAPVARAFLAKFVKVGANWRLVDISEQRISRRR